MILHMTHFEGPEIVATHDYDPAPPRCIRKEIAAYYSPDYVVVSVLHCRNPHAGTPEAAIILCDKRDAGKPFHEWKYQSVDVYVDML